ncbi:MAG: DUF4834 domain-containing protein [Flavobacteriales bacterium]|nr:MAG: DUF4834 domain-containing protein [Flavobacteriales bacterium]
MPNLLRTILIILLIYFVIRLFTRYVMPFLLRMFVNKAQRNFEQKMNEMHGQQEQRPEGEMRVDYNPNKNQKKKKDDDGEYVDYEEVD